MMRFKVATILTLAAAFSVSARAADAVSADAAEEVKENPELEAEIAYVEALVNYGYPDFAAPIIEVTKKRWPESDARFFAIEITGMLALGDFDGAEKRIAALPDRKSSKYWAARLAMANSYFGRGKKDECVKIYEEFFNVFKTPPADLRKFHMEACYAYGQLLVSDKQFAKAAERYASLLTLLKVGSNEWCNIACETVEIYLRLITETGTDAKNQKQRKDLIKKTNEIVDKILWQEDKPVYFGRAVSMKAHLAQLDGNLDRASEIIEDYMPTLQEIHDQIVAFDPEGSQGLLKQSPLPECMYLQAKMLWEEVQTEAARKPKRDDEKIKALMFGPKVNGGKRQGSRGAFNMLVNVFLNYETSAWAPAAGELSEVIREFAEKEYKAKIKTKVTPEQIAKVRAAQFRDANEKFNAGQSLEAIEAYLTVLAKYPEAPESIAAVENVAAAYIDLALEAKDDKAKSEEYRMNADAVEGYLAERFAGSPNKLMMTAAGDAALRIAAREQQYHNMARADWLYTEFITNYRKHPMAANFAAKNAMDAQKAERYDDAIKYWGLIAKYYTNNTVYASSLAQLSFCHGKLGDKKEEIEYINAYLPIETVKIRKLQAQFQLAQMYQRDGLAIIAEAATNATPEEVEAAEKRGTAQIIRAVKTFGGFTTEADAALKDPSTNKDDLGKYAELREAALFMVGECWGRMNRPEKNLAMYRERAAASYEKYVAEYPDGKYSKGGYVKLGTIYTALGDMAKSKDALDRLSRKFPDSDEAKNAKPRLAKNLIEMGMKKEGADIYAEMLRTDGAYSAGQFLNAGEALIEAKSWELANQAFERTIRLAGTNQTTTAARARLGMAKCSWKQGSLMEAREALDLFLADPKMSRLPIAADAYFMMVEVASEQGRTEKDSTMRGKCFNAAIGALKKVRVYWKNRPSWEQDSLDLLSGNVLIDRMKAEEAMGLKEEATETCGRAASTFQVFIQAHGVSDARPFEKMEPGERENLERAYSNIVPLFSKMGAEQADRVIKFGQEYVDLFPNGRHRTEVENCMNKAKADLPNKQ